MRGWCGNTLPMVSIFHRFFKIRSASRDATQSAHIDSQRPEVVVYGKTASMELGAGERLFFEKVNNTWRLTGGSRLQRWCMSTNLRASTRCVSILDQKQVARTSHQVSTSID